jgi:hypothetical protein
MFKKIKEFIAAVAAAYYIININKFNAKNAVEDYREKVERLSNVAKTMENLYDNLKDAYIYFPTDERQDFIHKTMYLLSYGRKDSNGRLIDMCGLRTLYHSEADYGRNKLAQLEDLYNEGKYDEVMTKTEEYNNRLEEFFVLYGIKDIDENIVEENE